MTVEQAFDKRIQKFLDEQPNSSASKTIRQIERSNPSFKSFYILFDDFTYKLGIEMIARDVVNERTGKILGYIPCIKYSSNKFLNEKPRVEPLIDSEFPLNLIDCYEYLAKELLYRIMRIQDLDELISATQRSLGTSY